MKSFVEIPYHCSVIVPLTSPHNMWVLLDVATVDAIDGVLILSDKLGVPQTVTNGMRYKITIPEQEHKFVIPPEVEQEFHKIEPAFLSQKYLTVVLSKEDAKRDENFNIIEPIEFEWINRFALKLPVIDQEQNSPNGLLSNTAEYLPKVVKFPPTLNPKIALLLVETTTIKDQRSHHFKQWVGIRYSKDGKFKKIVGGFRLIQTARPYSSRNVTWLGGTPNPEENPTEEKLGSALQECLSALEKEIGIKLTAEQTAQLKVHHNYTGKNIQHVWAY